MNVRRILFPVLGIAAGLAAAGAIYVRAAPMTASAWHADPMEAQRTGRPNDHLLGPGGDGEALRFAGTPAEAMAALDAAARADGATVLAGAPEEGWMTWVDRSALMGFPDAVSARAVPEGEGSRVAVWSRSRFGHDDMGVNADRVERWGGALR